MENAVVKAADVNVDEIGRIGKMLAMSGYFGKMPDVEVGIAQMATKVLAGREMGFGPFASANGIHIIQGRPAVGANLMASAVKSHPCYDYRVREMTAQVCRLEFFERADNGEWESLGVSEFTEADARAAGTQNMQKFARNMLFARAMSNGVRWFCPNVFNGNAVYVPEELGASVDGDGNVIDSGYTVHKPQPQAQPVQNGDGHTEWADVDVTVDMSAVPEDKAGSIAAPVATPDDIKLMHAFGNALDPAEWKKAATKATKAAKVESTKDLPLATIAELTQANAAALREKAQAHLSAMAEDDAKLMMLGLTGDTSTTVEDIEDGWPLYHFAHALFNAENGE